MEFINRENELQELKTSEALSKRKLFVVALYGLRRVGKTRLILEFLKNRGLYFFVNKNKTSADLLREYEGILKEKKVLGELEGVDSWDQLIEILIKRDTSPVVFDEFQNFYFVEPSVFGILQKNIDLNENSPGLIILSGSLVGLMKDTFQNSKEPLYGRIKKGKKLQPLSLSSCLQIGKRLKLERKELLKVYGIFGGYPKYYISMEDFSLEKRAAEEMIDSLFLMKDAPLEDEVNTILAQEFGGRKGVYHSILEAIAAGNNTLSSIAGYLNKPITSITRQVHELKDYFELIEYEMPFRGKRGVYRIQYPLMQFWFSQIYKNYSEYASRNPEFISRLKKNLNVFFGKSFERAAGEFVVSSLNLVGAKRQWGRIPAAEKGENTYEIDLMGTAGKTTYVFEFKWKDLNAKEAWGIVQDLRTKANYVPGLPSDIKFGLVARKIEHKERIRSAGYTAYDLEDF